MNVKSRHTIEELQTLYRTEKNAKLAQRIHGIYLANKGLTCPEIMDITGAARRTVQQWVHRYNKRGIAGLRDKPRPGTPRRDSNPQPSDRQAKKASPVTLCR